MIMVVKFAQPTCHIPYSQYDTLSTQFKARCFPCELKVSKAKCFLAN